MFISKEDYSDDVIEKVESNNEEENKRTHVSNEKRDLDSGCLLRGQF